MQVQSNNFIRASEIAVNNSEQRNAVVTGTGTAYQKRLAAMFATSKEHGEAMRQQAAKRRALNEQATRSARTGRNQDARKWHSGFVDHR